MKRFTDLFIIFLVLYLILNSLCYGQDNDNGNNDEKKIEIDEINIKINGKKIFEESFLKNIIASREGDGFLLSTYLLDAERLKKYYFDNGFFNATVDTNLIYNKVDNEVIENFIITPNVRYRYHEVQYEGLDSLEQFLREKIFSHQDRLVSEGKFYSRDSIKLEQTRILTLLNNNGYATASSENPEVFKYETDVVALKNKVNVKFVFDPKIKYTFGPTKITFKGKKRYNVTRQDIERELTYSQHQVYDKEEVVNSELNLAKISILETPRILIDTINPADQTVSLKINAVIGNKYDLTPELFGYYFQNQFYIGPGISFSDKYFLGGGRVLTTTARFYFHSLNDNRLELVNSIYQPFLFNNRNITGNWNIGVEYRLTPETNSAHIKNSFGVAYDLPRYTYINRLTSSWDIENIRYTLKNPTFIEDSTLETIAYNYFSSTIGFGVIHNSVNNLQFPYKGYYQSYEVEESGLLGYLVSKLFNTETISYVKFTNFNAAYFNMTNRNINVASVLAGKFSGGIIIEYGNNTFNLLGQEISSDRVPTEEKFVCGGSSSIRGWGAKQLGIVADKSIGGNFIIENSIEHRIRPFLEADNILLRDLGFASFIDFGNVWSEIGKFKLNEIAWAAGAGIRYYTVIGAIRFDVGFKVYDPQPGPVGGSHWLFGTGANFSDKYNFQFGIGNTF